MDHADEFRKAAAECLALAQKTTDPRVRISLLTLAQKWLKFANWHFSGKNFDDVLQEFNDQQMIRH